MSSLPPIDKSELQSAKVLDTTFTKIMVTDTEVYAQQSHENWIQVRPKRVVHIQSYVLSELENSNLRKCLAWAGKHLTHEQRLELASMIKKPLDEGGVVQDGHESDFEYLREICAKCVKAAGVLREAIEAADTNTHNQVVWFKAALEKANWFGRAEALATYFMGLDPPTPEACLAEIRNTKSLDTN